MRIASFVFVIGLCSVAAADEYWNQFRGPHEDGTSTETGMPVTFEEGSKEIVWKTPVQGKAWSSPVVWGDQIWITNAPELETNTKEPPKLTSPVVLSAICISLQTGKILHDLPIFEVSELQITHNTNSFASPTPYIEEGRVYVHFGAYGTACLDTQTGSIIWKRSIIFAGRVLHLWSTAICCI
jgi:hypothetical protein